ncbi:MAG: hypothetical protein SFU27_13855 [Thermonemataceae bacterium]|nr:hypothetical protein [Thermonemataceae bacterium]
MKNILLIVFIFCTNWLVYAQSVQSLYVLYEESNNSERKVLDAHWNYDNFSISEDVFIFMKIICNNVPLRVATINKRSSMEVEQSELSALNVRTDVEVRAMISAMPYEEGVQYFMDLEREKKLFVVEMLPNNKARIHQVRNITSRVD